MGNKTRFWDMRYILSQCGLCETENIFKKAILNRERGESGVFTKGSSNGTEYSYLDKGHEVTIDLSYDEFLKPNLARSKQRTPLRITLDIESKIFSGLEVCDLDVVQSAQKIIFDTLSRLTNGELESRVVAGESA